jgi:hypothetical protein
LPRESDILIAAAIPFVVSSPREKCRKALAM